MLTTIFRTQMPEVKDTNFIVEYNALPKRRGDYPERDDAPHEGHGGAAAVNEFLRSDV